MIQLWGNKLEIKRCLRFVSKHLKYLPLHFAENDKILHYKTAIISINCLNNVFMCVSSAASSRCAIRLFL